MSWWCPPGVNDSLGFSSCRLLKSDCNGRYDDVLRNVTWHDALDSGVNVAPDPGQERPGPVRGWAEPGICRHSPPSSSSSSLVFSRCQSPLTPITRARWGEKDVITQLMSLKRQFCESDIIKHRFLLVHTVKSWSKLNLVNLVLINYHQVKLLW